MPNLTTQQICAGFRQNLGSHNPVTGRGIKYEGPTWKRLTALCVGVEYQNELQLPDELIEYPLNDDVYHYILEFIDLQSCDRLTRNGQRCRRKWIVGDTNCEDYCLENIAEWYPREQVWIPMDLKHLKKPYLKKFLNMHGVHLIPAYTKDDMIVEAYQLLNRLQGVTPDRVYDYLDERDINNAGGRPQVGKKFIR